MVFTKDINDFIMLTKDIEPARIPADDPEQDLMNDVLCGMTAENHRRQMAKGA